jgi:riboflavin kinase/FMN adenylyltransferase
MNKHYYHFNVIKGDGYGNKIGIPTINLNIKDNPGFIKHPGVYSSTAIVGESKYKALLYYGPKYLLNKKTFTLELYILDTSFSLKSSKIQISINSFIRKPIKFSDVSEYKKQVQNDVKKAEILN